MTRMDHSTGLWLRRLQLALFAIIILLPLAWPLLETRWGTVQSMREIPSTGPIGPKLEGFPSIGELRWVSYSERPPRIRILGNADVQACYKWMFSRDMPARDMGMGIFVPPHPSGDIGRVGDRYYDDVGTSGAYYYHVIILLDGRFQMDIRGR